MWCETWLKMHCPKCKANNWLYNGHSDDYGLDREAVECWSCHHKFWLDESYSREQYECECGEMETEDGEVYKSDETFEQRLEHSAVLGKENP